MSLAKFTQHFSAAFVAVGIGLFTPAIAQSTSDIVVYGGTSAGISAAIQASRMGKSVVLIHYKEHLGGLTTSGLGRTDAGKKQYIGGISREFYQQLHQYYKRKKALSQGKNFQEKKELLPTDPAQWAFEPHVAEKVFEDMLRREKVTIVRNEPLLRGKGGVEVVDNRIVSLKTMAGKTYRAKMFIDATYEGDLLAESGVSFIVGREGNAQYGETLNGIQTKGTTNHMFSVDGMRHPPKPLPESARVDPYVVPGDPSSGLLPGVNPDAGGKDGEPDKRIQAYCYRLCLTDVPENQVPFAKPEGFKEEDFELLFRMFEAGEKRIPWLPGRMPNRKTDTNNRWAVSTDYIGGADAYPEAGYEERRKIEKEHEYWNRGLLYCLANHPRVPQEVRQEVSKWGYAKDEFVDNNNWPYDIYVREGRRMVSDYVMTEHHARHTKKVSDSVGIGSYTMDSHNTQRYVTPEGYVQNEGNIEVGSKPYEISYLSTVPRQGEAENLLVSVAVSASHILFGSLRMEPVFMILGQSTATAAALAIDKEISVQELDYETLKRQLVNDEQILSVE